MKLLFHCKYSFQHNTVLPHNLHYVVIKERFCAENQLAYPKKSILIKPMKVFLFLLVLWVCFFQFFKKIIKLNKRNIIKSLDKSGLL